MVTDAYVGAKVKFAVTWGGGGASPTSAAANASSASGKANTTFYVQIWLLGHEMGGATFTGTARACGTTLPDLELNLAGDVAVGGVGNGQNALVNPTIPNTAFDAITRTFPEMGTQGFNPGDTIMVAPSTGLLGLKDSAWDTAAWPAACPTTGTCTGVTCPTGMPGAACSGGKGGPFNGGDITDDDGDGHPGVTAIPPNGTDGTSSPSCSGPGSCKYYFPPTAVGLGGSASVADKVYIVSRNRFSLSGMRMNDCSKGSGKASITLFDNHAVGCHISGGGECNDMQAGFVDTNRPVYVDASGNAFGSSSSNNGTVDVYQFPQGTTPTCAMVRSMLP
jgi:hypothetical protein